MQRLVGEVDAELREGVEHKVLEAEDVEDADGEVAVCDGDVVVDDVDAPGQGEGEGEGEGEGQGSMSSWTTSTHQSKTRQ